MKDETFGVPRKGFVWLKSKMYISITEANHNSKKQKVIYKNAVDDERKYEDYKKVFFNRSYMRDKGTEFKANIII